MLNNLYSLRAYRKFDVQIRRQRVRTKTGRACAAEVRYHNEAASAYYTAHKGRRERADPIQSLVINMAINAYPIVTGGVTRQYDQNTVRLIHRSNKSLVDPEICEVQNGILNV